MRKKRYHNQFHAQPDHLIYRFAEEAGDGNTDAEGNEEFDPRAFAQSTSETIKALQKEIANSKKTSNLTTSELKSIKETLSALTESLKSQTTNTDTETSEEEGEDETPPKRTTRATAKSGKTTEENPEIAELKKTLTTLQKQLEAEKKRSDAAEERTRNAETRRLNSERDRLLIAATTNVNAISATDAADFLRGRTVYDEDTDTWGIKDGDDILDMEEGVKKFLPKYMIQAKTTRGGAGGHSTTEDNGVSKAMLRQNAIAAGTAAKKNPALAARYSKAKKDYADAGGDVTEIIDEVAALA